MRRLEPAQVTIGVFWTVYAILGAWTLYQMTDPVNLTLMVVLGGYATVLAITLVVLLFRRRWTRQTNVPQR